MKMGFNENVWNLARKIPKGKVTTYKEIARKLHCMAYRAVGNALNKNPYGAWGWVGGKTCRRQVCLVPCHRVVRSDGSVGGFAHGTMKKAGMLEKEGVGVKKGKIELKRHFYRFY